MYPDKGRKQILIVVCEEKKNFKKSRTVHSLIRTSKLHSFIIKICFSLKYLVTESANSNHVLEKQNQTSLNPEGKQ